MESRVVGGPRVIFEGDEWLFSAEYVAGDIWHVKNCTFAEEKNPSIEVEANWTTKQLGAVLQLIVGIGEDEEHATDPEMVQYCYQIAEPLFKDWPIELRPIP